MKNKIVIVCLSLIFITGAYIGYEFFIAEPEVVKTNSLRSFDTSNPNELVGWSDHVFIGKVTKKIGEDDSTGRPKTQFSVQVMKNIKGELGKEAVVSQFAGHVVKGIKKMFVIDESDTLIEEGKIYLFSGRVDDKGNISLVVGAGNQIIHDTSEIGKVVSTMQKAKENQILNPDEVRLKGNMNQ